MSFLTTATGVALGAGAATLAVSLVVAGVTAAAGSAAKTKEANKSKIKEILFIFDLLDNSYCKT